jgi:MFS family permease
MALFAYVGEIARATGIPEVAILVTGVAMHGLCFGCFVFIAFMVVDEETTPDVRASAQSLFSLIVFGIGIMVGSKVAAMVADAATLPDNSIDYTKLFSFPMWGSLACLVVLLAAYPRRGRPAQVV